MNWKNNYQYQLMAARADFLWQLIDLNEPTLTETAVFANWSPKDLLNHIAEWDLFFTNRVKEVVAAAGEPIVFPMLDLTEHNEALYQKHKKRSLVQSIELFGDARTQFLEQFSLIDDHLRAQSFSLANGRMSPVQRWLDLRFLHDQMHTKDLQLWREKESVVATVGEPVLIQAVAISSRNQFLALLPLVPENEWSSRPICGTWSMKDLLGHIVDWELFGVAGLKDILQGNPPQMPFSSTIQSWNEEHAEIRKDESWETIYAVWESTRQKLAELVTQLSEEDWQRPFIAPWGGDPTNAYQWVRIWLDHEREHAHELAEILIK